MNATYASPTLLTLSTLPMLLRQPNLQAASNISTFPQKKAGALFKWSFSLAIFSAFVRVGTQDRRLHHPHPHCQRRCKS
ncbi:hypothetical protein BDR03DRAFT_958659 [Suillus americanus]|nr:hypothetical protein BDR03DRAFT_958659 [Suillus americanus]